MSADQRKEAAEFLRVVRGNLRGAGNSFERGFWERALRGFLSRLDR